MEKGTFLRFYVEEGQRHHGVLLWEWLLEKACGLNIRGGSAFQAIGGFGRHRQLHESRFFELAGSTGVEIDFIVGEGEADQMIALVQREGLRVFYARFPAIFGVINAATDDPQDVGAAAGTA